MNCIIENDFLKANVEAAGAQLVSLVIKETGEELIWQRDPEIWADSAPILFPYVGRLKDSYMLHEGKKYDLPMHGFASKQLFSPVDSQTHSCSLTLTENTETLSVYPFRFRLTVTFSIAQNGLRIGYEVENCDNENIYFFLGSHPGFTLPVDSFEKGECYLKLHGLHEMEYYQLEDDLLNPETKIVPLQNSCLNLTKSLFDNDALIMKNPSFDQVTLLRGIGQKDVTVSFDQATAIGFWAKPNAPYVCIEPWMGVDDNAESEHEISRKEGVLSLQPGETFTTGYHITV